MFWSPTGHCDKLILIQQQKKAMKRGSVNGQVSDPPEASNRLSKLRKMDRADPALMLSYDRATRAPPVQWSNFEHIVVL